MTNANLDSVGSSSKDSSANAKEDASVPDGNSNLAAFLSESDNETGDSSNKKKKSPVVEKSWNNSFFILTIQ